MPPLTEGQQKAAALYAEFRELRAGEIADAPLIHSEVRELLQEAAALNGIAVEHSGHKLIVLFRRPERALEMARQLQTKMAKIRQAELNRMSLEARVMLGFGDIVLQQGKLRDTDWVGRLSFYMQAIPANAIGAQKVFAEQFPPRALQPPPRPTTRPDLVILPLPTQDEETRMSFDSGAGGTDAVFHTLMLRVRGQSITVRASDTPVLVGRDKSCQVQVSGDTASRVHGRIEFSNDKFYYADDSRNGTYVLTGSGQEVLVHRERIVLVGEGAISPGAPLAKQSGEVVRFTCRASRLSIMGEAPDPGDTRPLR